MRSSNGCHAFFWQPGPRVGWPTLLHSFKLPGRNLLRAAALVGTKHAFHQSLGAARYLNTKSAPSTEPNSPRKLRMIILGAPVCAGDWYWRSKGTQGERILKKWDLATIGVGDLLRAEILRGTPLGSVAKKAMSAGTLLPDEIVLRLIEPQLHALSDRDWILDGFPRKASQATLLDKLLASSEDSLNLVVNLNVPDDVILERIEGRWLHAPSGRVYNNSFNPPKIPGKDDLTGEDLTQRPDDTAEIFSKRLVAFHTENEPLLQHYAGTDAEVMTLTGSTSDEIYPQLEALLEDRVRLDG
ncbi:BZ3500_MvSof-1268-A1-R1_Chr8-1g09926 [Microbotryum saponariae]|uniref:BZ3500_MvSof-1268-A1-R1_Chr8-1g09926 protein n=1 Tax=Microbotryum saponariae TaxID=289078 RepID=A0A2X0NJQ2_9BASI|nr:BZ3500_MvSof-1268-A1-R1_Chr8-1g09926 [Microbotryum saponariae]SDA08212.1 BZ3501_MvSof-1269-A2-R1_Chr8-1g09649 [Microbotryum saponariae]